MMLAIFLEDARIPLDALGRLWQLPDTQARRLGAELDRRSLVIEEVPAQGTCVCTICSELLQQEAGRARLAGTQTCFAGAAHSPSRGGYTQVPRTGVGLWRHTLPTTRIVLTLQTSMGTWRRCRAQVTQLDVTSCRR